MPPDMDRRMMDVKTVPKFATWKMENTHVWITTKMIRPFRGIYLWSFIRQLSRNHHNCIHC